MRSELASSCLLLPYVQLGDDHRGQDWSKIDKLGGDHGGQDRSKVDKAVYKKRSRSR
jgi:hypothetical protein